VHVRYAPLQMVKGKLFIYATTELSAIAEEPCRQVFFWSAKELRSTVLLLSGCEASLPLMQRYMLQRHVVTPHWLSPQIDEQRRMHADAAYTAIPPYGDAEKVDQAHIREFLAPTSTHMQLRLLFKQQPYEDQNVWQIVQASQTIDISGIQAPCDAGASEGR